MTEEQVSFWRRNRWLAWLAGSVLFLLAVAAGVVSVVLHHAEPYVRVRIVAALEQHFHARVELDSFHMSLTNGLWAEGKGLRIWPPDSAAQPTPGSQPLIHLAEFRFHAPLHYMQGGPIRISVVQLKGLEVDLPPRSRFALVSHDTANAKESQSSGTGLLQFKIGSIACTGARLMLETDKPGKQPLVFAIARLTLTDVSSGGTMGFKAELTNPRPKGTILTRGSFGPWVVDDPGATPISGDYNFEHADLATFRSIAGTLDSAGHFQGVLRNLTVDGETRTPNFQLSHFGNPLPLRTRFHARVDATNGNTWLDPVEATLGHSHFIARGEIVRVAPARNGSVIIRTGGHDIDLTVNVDRGHIEDFLLLASRSTTPLLTGPVTMKTSLQIPPGSASLRERLKMNGDFLLDEAQFTSAKIQDRIQELSLRAQGRPGDVKTADAEQTTSTMQGDFQIANGVVTLPALQYTVPGAQINLKGTYHLEGGAMYFLGHARMQAKVSQMVGGWKGLLLKPVDRYFQKNGAGTEVPIHIEGTRENPDFGIDFDRMKTTSAQRPGGP